MVIQRFYVSSGFNALRNRKEKQVAWWNRREDKGPAWFITQTNNEKSSRRYRYRSRCRLLRELQEDLHLRHHRRRCADQHD